MSKDKKGMDMVKSEVKKGGNLKPITLEGSGRSAYPKPKKLNKLCY